MNRSSSVRPACIWCPLLLTALLLWPILPFAQPDPVIARMADSVSTERLREHILALERAGGHGSRVSFTAGNDSAAIYLRDAFRSLSGLARVALDSFTIASAVDGLNSVPLVNVVATLKGRLDSTRIVVAGAHFDCSGSRMGSTAWNAQWKTMSVPGADDNATGLAALLEMARIMSDPGFRYSPDWTIMFVAFGAEESGPAYSGSHHGSKHFAAEAASTGEDLAGMVSIDMIGYNPLRLYQAIIANAASQALAKIFHDAALSYAPGLTTMTFYDATATYSDHDSFWQKGVPAVCLMENAPPWSSNTFYEANPYYHKSSDTSGTVNIELVRKVTQMALGAVASLATTTTSVQRDPVEPAEEGYALRENYPNPFNPSTIITYTVGGYRHQESGVSGVRLVVSDVLGREVAVLVNEKKAPGTYTVAFDGNRQASGVYFYRLTVGTYSETKSMILLK